MSKTEARDKLRNSEANYLVIDSEHFIDWVNGVYRLIRHYQIGEGMTANSGLDVLTQNKDFTVIWNKVAR